MGRNPPPRLNQYPNRFPRLPPPHPKNPLRAALKLAATAALTRTAHAQPVPGPTRPRPGSRENPSDRALFQPDRDGPGPGHLHHRLGTRLHDLRPALRPLHRPLADGRGPRTVRQQTPLALHPRDNLVFHDIEKICAAHCVASILRWSKRGPFGQHMAAPMDEIAALWNLRRG